jgi:hypothetical protein
LEEKEEGITETDDRVLLIYLPFFDLRLLIVASLGIFKLSIQTKN